MSTEENYSLLTHYYDEFVTQQLQSAHNPGQSSKFLNKHKKRIIEQVLFNLGLKLHQKLTSAQMAAFQTELMSILPILSGLPSFFSNGDELESYAKNDAEEKKLALTAKNYLRLFMRGTQVGQDGAWVWESPLFTEQLYETIAHKGDAALLSQVRDQIQVYLENAYNYIKDKNDPNEAKLFKTHLFPLLASLAFFDYPEGSEIKIPVRIDEAWDYVTYKIEKLDLSPKPADSGIDGLIARLLAPKDRFFMYGLTPIAGSPAKANPILLLNGTPPPGVPGEPLAVNENFAIGKSVGEAHNWTEINKWVEARTNIEAFGHSKGGAMGQMIAAKYPENITSVDCLASPGLHSTTLKRLSPAWENRIKRKKSDPNVKLPVITIYDQSGDPVFHAEQGFLAGTQIYHVLTNKEKPSLNAYPIPSFFSRIWEGHSLSSLGYSTVGLLKGNWEQENKRELRAVLDTQKGIKNYFVTIKGKLGLIMDLLAPIFNKAINKHKRTLLAVLFGLTLTAITVALISSSFGLGLLAPAGIWLTSKIGLYASLSIMSVASLLLSGALTYLQVIPLAFKLAANLTLNAINTIYSLLEFTTTVLLSLPSMISNGLKYLYHNPQTLVDFAKYMVSFQFIPDMVSAAFWAIRKGLTLVLEGGYIAVNVLYKSVTNLWYQGKNDNEPSDPGTNVSPSNMFADEGLLSSPNEQDSATLSMMTGLGARLDRPLANIPQKPKAQPERSLKVVERDLSCDQEPDNEVSFTACL